MYKAKLNLLFGVVVALGLILAACAPAAPVADRGEFAGLAEFEGISLSAGSCDYGGKILSIEAVDELTVVFTLCRPDPAFLAKVAFTPFGIQPEEYIAFTGGSGDLLEAPVGTGPYEVSEWSRGEQVVFTRFADYWGEAGTAETVTLRWLTEGASRLQELQAGTADFITSVGTDDYGTVEADSNLVLIPWENPNIFYVGFTNTFSPFDDPVVRQAIAMGIDRQRIVDNFYPGGSEVASHFTPCSIPNGCEGDAWYDFDPEAARAMLADAGYPDGFETSIFYRDVFRVYLPEPGLVAVELQAQLADNLGITAEVVPMESGEFIAASTDGQLDGIHLLGWGADYPHVTNFLDFHFGASNPQFGDAHPAIYEALLEASSIADVAAAAPLYLEANNAIRELVPMIPIAHGAAAHAARASLDGAYYPPFGSAQFSKMDTGDSDMVFVQAAEPIGLYCADETDGESLRPCQQAVETLLEYADDSGDTVPELATSCESNADSTVWTCNLRDGVKFHDGSDFDADDVVASFAAGLDASNPYHVGNTGGFDYFAYLWDGLMNVPAE
ncbi:MAG: ABC transporter substrate-binding protein [Anaerolineales bacterium]